MIARTQAKTSGTAVGTLLSRMSSANNLARECLDSTVGIDLEVYWVTTTPQLPFRQTSPLDIAPELRALRRGTVHRVRTPAGDEAWLVIDYAQVRRLLDDERLGRSHPDPENAPRIADSALLGIPLGNFETEAADHSRMRTLLQPHFSPRHLQALLPRVEELRTTLLD